MHLKRFVYICNAGINATVRTGEIVLHLVVATTSSTIMHCDYRYRKTTMVYLISQPCWRPPVYSRLLAVLSFVWL